MMREIEAFQLSRGRKIKLTVFLPKGRGRVPAVIFSHGNPVPVSAYHYLAEAWARAGIATIFPWHSGEGEKIALSKNWGVRPRDLKSLVGAIKRVSSRIDPDRVGLGGHSHGAHSAAVLAGAPLHIAGGKSLRLADSRVRAFFFLSPPLSGMMGLRTSGWKNIRSPILAITGTRDSSQSRTVADRLELFERASSVRKEQWVIAGADHESFMDSVLLFENGRMRFPDRKVLRIVREKSTRFWLDVLNQISR